MVRTNRIDEQACGTARAQQEAVPASGSEPQRWLAPAGEGSVGANSVEMIIGSSNDQSISEKSRRVRRYMRTSPFRGTTVEDIEPHMPAGAGLAATFTRLKSASRSAEG